MTDRQTNTTEAFAGQVVADVAAAMSGVLTSMGHRLGLYKAMRDAGEMTSAELADATSLDERYVREWLNNQVAGGYVAYAPLSATYRLPEAHAPVLADEESPVFLAPALEVCSSLWFDRERIENAFRTGEGIAWQDHHGNLFCGTEALFRPGYKAGLVGGWIAALDGVTDKLEAGGKVADIGCGHGASSIVMAQAFPNTTVIGYDNHEESIRTAGLRADEAGVSGNCRFEHATAKDYVETGFDLICFMDALHDMGDPVGAAHHAFAALAPGGTLLLVEPAANDKLEDNINPVSRLYYAASTGVCTPCSRSQEVGLALGAQAGPQRLSEVLREAGFGRVRVAAKTPFNLVIEVRKTPT